MPKQSTKQVGVGKFADERLDHEQDHLAVEEPLEIRIGYYEDNQFTHKPISITMRTPGNDFELAAGFLFTEGIIESCDQIATIKHCGPPLKEGYENTVRIDLTKDVSLDMSLLDRHFYTTSSCGVCGKSSIEALSYGIERADRDSGENAVRLKSDAINTLPERFAAMQEVFAKTGGLHASALFDGEGEIESVFEDVGRHNALDKLIGAKFLTNETPLASRALYLSGRISFELVQKALVAGIRVIVAVGSPSSLAVELAEEYDITLVGFARDNRFNVYCGSGRILR